MGPSSPASSQCPACGFVNPPAMRFCGGCGKALGSAPRKTTTRRRRRSASSQPERRQLTVMFCDLEGSTQLSGALDPEDLGRLLLAYREAAIGAIKRQGGTIGRFIGDGLLIFFGYPTAHEDDPDRAVRAGLGILAAMRELNARLAAEAMPALHLRIGIHTGLVVVGDLGAGMSLETNAVVGETPNIAARLQALAGPDQVVISGDTHLLTEGHFIFERQGSRALAGVARPVEVLTVIAEVPRRERMGPRRTHTPMVNRDRETAMLQEAWQAALDSHGNAVTIEGEPGIGKSRLIAEFRANLRDPGQVITVVCNEDDQGSAFQPVIDWLVTEFHLPPDVPGEERWRVMQAAFSERGLQGERLAPLANLLGAVSAEPAGEHDATPRRRRRRLIDALVQLVLGMAAQRPVLLVAEDCHWADDSTLTFLRALVERIRGAHVLVVVTMRSGQPAPTPSARHILLDRLSLPSARRLAQMAAGASIPDALLDRIVDRTDGVPLFVEEVAFTALDRSASTETASDIPMTLRDSLMAQLDRLEEAKPIAQLAAVLGRSFRIDEIAAVLDDVDGGHAGLDETLRRLEQARFIEHDARTGLHRFRHALIHEAAYGSLLRENRQKYHLRIATALRERFGDSAEGRPEMLALHFAAAGRIDEAVSCYAAAAVKASRLSATVEALHHYETALDLLSQLPESRERTEQEIGLQIALAAQIVIARGNAAPGVEVAITRARDLCETFGSERLLIRVLRTLQTFHMVRGNLQPAHAVCLQIMEKAARLGDSDTLVQAHRPYGLCLLYLGRFAEARQVLRRTLELYDPERHANHRFEYGSDPAVLAHTHLGWAEWFLGDEPAALAASAEGIAKARALNHPHSLCFALGFHACLEQFRDDAAGALAAAEELGAIAEAMEFAYWSAWSGILRGWAIGRTGDPAGGEQLLRQGLAGYEATGARLLCPYALSLLAGLLPRDRRDEALQLLDGAIQQARAGSVLFALNRMLEQRAALMNTER